MKRPVRLLIVLMLALLAVTAPLLVIHAVRADAAPPPGAAASDVVPDQGTQVQMISETVVLDIQSARERGHDVAFVTADFLMRNLGTEAETMDVRFPLAWPTSWGAPNYNLDNVVVTVADQLVVTKQVDFAGQPWIVWPTAFPPRENVSMRVTYQTAATTWYGSSRGFPASSMDEFYYVLETGAGWRGPIGQGDIVFRFPEPASLEMIELNNAYPVYTSTTPTFVADGHELRWHFENLEPTAASNVRLNVIAPFIWQGVLIAREQAELHPADASVQSMLGSSYWAAIPQSHFGPQGSSLAQHFEPLAEAAFKRALELDPDNVQAHLNYALFLYARSLSAPVFDPMNPNPDFAQALEEGHRVLELDPDNTEIQVLGPALETAEAERQVTATPTNQVTATPLPQTLLPPASPTRTSTPFESPVARDAPTHPAVTVTRSSSSTPPSPTPIASAPPTNNPSGLVWIGLMLLIVAFAAVILKR
jgi:hypothetical protein